MTGYKGDSIADVLETEGDVSTITLAGSQDTPSTSRLSKIPSRSALEKSSKKSLPSNRRGVSKSVSSRSTPSSRAAARPQKTSSERASAVRSKSSVLKKVAAGSSSKASKSKKSVSLSSADPLVQQIGGAGSDIMPGRFSVGDYVVYASHGVGKVTAWEHETIDGAGIDFLVISFEQERMVLKIPARSSLDGGLRRVSSSEEIDEACRMLSEKGRVSRALWSRRAQEYGAKIRSGDPRAIAEVVRDLYRGSTRQSYSERQLYRLARERLAREVAAVEGIVEDAAIEKLESIMASGGTGSERNRSRSKRFTEDSELKVANG